MLFDQNVSLTEQLLRDNSQVLHSYTLSNSLSSPKGLSSSKLRLERDQRGTVESSSCCCKFWWSMNPPLLNYLYRSTKYVGRTCLCRASDSVKRVRHFVVDVILAPENSSVSSNIWVKTHLNLLVYINLSLWMIPRAAWSKDPSRLSVSPSEVSTSRLPNLSIACSFPCARRS